ncbi:MAG TPA: transglutaminase family protein [Chitinophagales bacterium]|nr:transglutaminase family protein [Chitinophagales bacterium]HRP40287.1 transglutaminase family protein [Chitinophagales bacterium]
MKLILESNNIDDYLTEIPPIIQFGTPLVKAKINWIKSQAFNKKEQAKLAFEIARDEVKHSFDTKNKVVTISAEQALKEKEGICFAKAHLLASLLRGMDIPTGFCYQRVLRKGTVDSGYALHGLNAVYLPETGWFRLDPRGNKQGIDSEFSITTEKLAYPIRKTLGEIDYPNVFIAPLPSVIKAMQSSKYSDELFYRRPEAL